MILQRIVGDNFGKIVRFVVAASGSIKIQECLMKSWLLVHVLRKHLELLMVTATRKWVCGNASLVLRHLDPSTALRKVTTWRNVFEYAKTSPLVEVSSLAQNTKVVAGGCLRSLHRILDTLTRTSTNVTTKGGPLILCIVGVMSQRVVGSSSHE